MVESADDTVSNQTFGRRFAKLNAEQNSIAIAHGEARDLYAPLDQALPNVELLQHFQGTRVDHDRTGSIFVRP